MKELKNDRPKFNYADRITKQPSNKQSVASGIKSSGQIPISGDDACVTASPLGGTDRQSTGKRSRRDNQRTGDKKDIRGHTFENGETPAKDAAVIKRIRDRQGKFKGDKHSQRSIGGYTRESSMSPSGCRDIRVDEKKEKPKEKPKAKNLGDSIFAEYIDNTY